MRVIEKVHGGYVHNRRVRQLSAHLAALIPANASVLDVGCGDGLLAARIAEARPDISFRGIDVLVRPETHIPVEEFDGSHIPAADNAYDVVMFVDVLHHTEDPMILLREAARVARQAIVIKDHTMNGPAAGATLRFMDRVGNARHDVNLPYNYWTLDRWQRAFASLNLRPAAWRRRLALYPFWADSFFGRSLHFIARLDVPGK